MSAFPFNAQGKLTTLAGRADGAKQISADYTLDANLDYDVFVDAQAGPVVITLPLGIEGQEFYIQDATGTAGTNNITFVPTAPNIIVQPAPTINTNFGTRRWIFKTVTIPGPVTFGVWYYEQEVSGGGGTPTGNPNTGAYFDGAGNLNSNIDFQFDSSLNAMSFGQQTGGGDLQATNNGSFAHGEGQLAGIITSSGIGSYAHGNAISDGAISAVGDGSTAAGSATDIGSSITAQTFGSVANGVVTTGAIIQSTGAGAVASGSAAGAGSVISAQFEGTVARGNATNGGAISATQIAATAFGFADGAGSNIQASGFASLAFGGAVTAGQIFAQSEGSLAIGAVSGGGTVVASGKAAIAHGNVDTAAAITASGDASHAYGVTFDAGSAITASSAGSTAWGASSAQANITASNNGAEASGAAQGVGCQITASARGTKAFGSVASAFAAFPSAITATADGSLAFGDCIDGGQIQCNGGLAFGSVTSDGTQFSVITAAQGCLAFGFVNTGGTIQSNGTGIAFGFVTDTGSLIRASGTASLCFGRATTGGLMEASGTSSIVAGRSAAVGDPHYASGELSFSFGESIVNPVMLCFAHGRFASITGSSNAWVDTDPLWVLGIGTATGSEENAIAIMKNADIHLRRTVTAAGTTGAQTIDKPAGSVNFAALAQTLVVTNSLVDANSIILCTVQTDDATAKSCVALAAGGSFTLKLNAAATAETRVSFLVIN